MSAPVFSRTVSILVCSLGIAAALVSEAASQGSSSRPLVSEAQFEAWQTELSNWGRWGKDDELELAVTRWLLDEAHCHA
jgi:hypothetical protein